jgi:hypothetical protein
VIFKVCYVKDKETANNFTNMTQKNIVSSDILQKYRKQILCHSLKIGYASRSAGALDTGNMADLAESLQKASQEKASGLIYIEMNILCQLIFPGD